MTHPIKRWAKPVAFTLFALAYVGLAVAGAAVYFSILQASE